MNKVYKTKISAIKVSENIDSGDVYLKEDLDISTGSAQDIFKVPDRGSVNPTPLGG